MKKIIITFMMVMSFMIIASLAIKPVEAVDSVSQASSATIPSELIKKYSDIGNIKYRSVKVYTYPIPVSTPGNVKIGYICLEQENKYGLQYTCAMIELNGNMLEGFDSSKLGTNQCVLNDKNIFNSNFIFDNNGSIQKSVQVPIQIIEKNNLQNVGKPTSLKVTDVGYSVGKYNNVMNVGTHLSNRNTGTLSVRDDQGKEIYNLALTDKYLVNFDNTHKGKKNFIVKYNSLQTTVTINFHKFAYILQSYGCSTAYDNTFYVPLGADLKKYGAGMLVYDPDADNDILGGWDSSFYGSNFYDAPINHINTNKAGTYNVTFKAYDDGGIVEGKVKVIVAYPKQVSRNNLSSNAQKTLPNKKNIVGYWNLENTKNQYNTNEGVGKWVFKTKQNSGSKIDVWNYVNEKWVKKGTYTTNTTGLITVYMNYNQLSPVVLAKNTQSTYTITYKLNGGINNKSNPTRFKVTSNTIKFKNPTRKGYIFKGWYNESNYRTKVSSLNTGSAGNRILYARWTKVTVDNIENLKLSHYKNQKLNVKYNKMSGVQGYQVQYSTNSKFLSKYTKSVNSSSNSLSFKIKKGGLYYVRVRAYKLDSAQNKVYGKYRTMKIKI